MRSSVNGDLTTAQIIIEDGAYFKGSIEIEKSPEKEGDKNVFSPTASAPAPPAGGAEPKSIWSRRNAQDPTLEMGATSGCSEFGGSHLRFEEFPFVVRRAIILLMRRAKGVRP